MYIMIFSNYTGNAMLNNALMTIEALAGLSHVSEITSAVLLSEANKHKIWELYPRMKSYTMLFTKNNPLFNDPKSGKEIYWKLIQKIISQVEVTGIYQCEVSGLRFNRTFTEFYSDVLKDFGLSEKEIGKKDLTINRCWFPLIGSLGSEAQALPQAKFNVRIHPICLIVIQFLPLSSIIYKKGILLFDSINFDFAKEYIARSTERVGEGIKLVSISNQIENVKDFDRGKGKCLLRAIDLYSGKIRYHEDNFTDISLWSFTNSGQGANCQIDRIPSKLFKNLVRLFQSPLCQPDLNRILNGAYADNFLDALQNGWDYNGLYPNKNFEGVSISFYEEYHHLISKADHLEYAKHIAGLIKKVSLSITEEKMLSKTDAYNQPEYAPFIQKVLVGAAEKGEWSLIHHLNIIEDADTLPVENRIHWIFKKVHFYFQKKDWQQGDLIKPREHLWETTAGRITRLAIQIIKKDESEKLKRHVETLRDSQKFKKFSLAPIFIRQCLSLTLSQAYSYFFPNYHLTNFALNYLLRVYFSQVSPEEVSGSNLPEGQDSIWLERIEAFSEFYIKYYLDKYDGDWNKFKKQILDPFPKNSNEFQYWLVFTVEKIRERFNALGKDLDEIEKLEESICYDEEGNYSPAFARFALQFCFNKQYQLKNL